MNFAADLPLLYADFGVVVTHTPQGGGSPASGRAIFDRPGVVQIGGEMIGTDYALRYPAATFPVVRRGDAFAIGGVGYLARESAQPGLDGLEMHVPLAKA